MDISFWKDIRLHITFSILRCHSQTRWSTVIIIHNSLPYRLGTVPWRDPTMYPKCNIQRHEQSGFDLATGWGYRKLPQHQDDLWAPTASRWGQAWRVREEPGPLQEQTRLATWWGTQPIDPFLSLPWWHEQLCVAALIETMRERGCRNTGTRNQLTLAKQSVCLTFFPLPKGVTSTYSLLHHLSTSLPLASQILEDHWASFHSMAQYLPRGSEGWF